MTSPCDCFQVDREDLIERYVAGEAAKPPLAEAERAAFEEHYFACTACFDKLQAARASRAALVAMQANRGRHWWVGWAAAAAVLLGAFGPWTALRPRSSSGIAQTTTPPRRAVPAELARLDPPRYDPAELRGAEPAASAQFQQAMRAYQDKQYAEAAPALEKLPTHPAAPFFAAASRLLAGQTDAAITALQAIPPASPFAEESKWLLAKAWLVKNEPAKAATILDTLAASGGDFATQAAQLRARLKDWESQP